MRDTKNAQFIRGVIGSLAGAVVGYGVAGAGGDHVAGAVGCIMGTVLGFLLGVRPIE